MKARAKQLTPLDKVEEGKIKKKYPTSNKKSVIKNAKMFLGSGIPHEAAKAGFISAKKLKAENDTLKEMHDIYTMVHGAPIQAKYGLEGHKKQRKLPTMQTFAEQMSHTIIPEDKYHEPMSKRLNINMAQAVREASADPFTKGRDVMARRLAARKQGQKVKGKRSLQGPLTNRRKKT